MAEREFDQFTAELLSRSVDPELPLSVRRVLEKLAGVGDALDSRYDPAPAQRQLARAMHAIGDRRDTF